MGGDSTLHAIRLGFITEPAGQWVALTPIGPYQWLRCVLHRLGLP